MTLNALRTSALVGSVTAIVAAGCVAEPQREGVGGYCHRDDQCLEHLRCIELSCRPADGAMDSGMLGIDASGPDGGPTDAGLLDAGSSEDSGPGDAGGPDAFATDAPMPLDSGIDAPMESDAGADGGGVAAIDAGDDAAADIDASGGPG